MANFIERFTGKTDYLDGDGVDLAQMRAVLTLYNAGQITAAQIKSMWSMTEGQAAEFDEVLGTRPLLVSAWGEWENRVNSVMVAGFAGNGVGWSGYETADDCRAMLGLERLDP